jgi:hypothetical protein
MKLWIAMDACQDLGVKTDKAMVSTRFGGYRYDFDYDLRSLDEMHLAFVQISP